MMINAAEGAGPSTLASPDFNPHPPRLKFPAGACDAHAHPICPLDAFPCAPNVTILPPPVSGVDYDRMLQTIGCERAVLVQAGQYGTDNSCMVANMTSGKLQYRGVAVIDAKTSDKTLEELDQAGVRAVRISCYQPGLSREAVAQRVAETTKRVKRMGWHLQFLTRLAMYPWIEQIIAKSSVVCVVDHFGFLPASEGIDTPGFKALLRLAQLEHVWFKLIGYRSSTQLPLYPDVKPLAQALYAAAPDRCLWGTDWPHPNIAKMPNDGDLADALGEWLPDLVARNRVLVDNPARLFGFK